MNNSVFRHRLKLSIEVAERVLADRLFQTIGAAKLKLRLAAADKCEEFGTDSKLAVDERRLRGGT